MADAATTIAVAVLAATVIATTIVDTAAVATITGPVAIVEATATRVIATMIAVEEATGDTGTIAPRVVLLIRCLRTAERAILRRHATTTNALAAPTIRQEATVGTSD